MVDDVVVVVLLTTSWCETWFLLSYTKKFERNFKNYHITISAKISFVLLFGKITIEYIPLKLSHAIVHGSCLVNKNDNATKLSVQRWQKALVKMKMH